MCESTFLGGIKNNGDIRFQVSIFYDTHLFKNKLVKKLLEYSLDLW